MPFNTPSPHRFLAARAPPPAKSERKSKATPQSGLRHVTVPTTTGTEGTSKTGTPIRKRFVIGKASSSSLSAERPNVSTISSRTGPRGTLGHDGGRRDGARHEELGLGLVETPRPRQVRPLKLARTESIEDLSPSSSPTSRFPQPMETVEDDENDDSLFTRIAGYEEQSVRSHLPAKDVDMLADFAREDNGQTTTREKPESEAPESEEMLFESEQPPSKKPKLHRSVRSSPTPQPQPRPQPHTLRQTPAPKNPSTRFKPYTITPRTNNLAPNPSTMTIATPSVPITSTRPHFILPPSSPSSPSRSRSSTSAANPPPEIFSPHRKKGRYVPGGLATCLQSWIVETAEPLFYNQLPRGADERSARVSSASTKHVRILRILARGDEDGDDSRDTDNSMAGEEGEEGRREREQVWARNGGVLFVLGAVVEEEHRDSTSAATAAMKNKGGSGNGTEQVIRIILSGQGGARARSGVALWKGCVLNLKPPLWDVEVGGETWRVCVEWGVSS